MENTTLGKKIAELRRGKGMKQDELAAANAKVEELTAQLTGATEAPSAEPSVTPAP